VIRGLSGTVPGVWEEGTQAQWLFELRRPLGEEILAGDPRWNKLLKSASQGDRIDAWQLAELLHTGSLKAVDPAEEDVRVLKAWVHSDPSLLQDATRLRHRLKAICRSRALSCAGTKIYPLANKKPWLTL
jgi:hypothetical protein